MENAVKKAPLVELCTYTADCAGNVELVAGEDVNNAVRRATERLAGRLDWLDFEEETSLVVSVKNDVLSAEVDGELVEQSEFVPW